MNCIKPAIIVHGGAKTISEDKVMDNWEGCRAAVEAGWGVLQNGGTAVEAVEAAIQVFERDQTFNAGYGSTLNNSGEVEVDAAIMDGQRLSWGAVGALQGIRHPISVACKIMKDKPRMLVSESGEQFARDHGIELYPKEDLVSSEQYQEWKEGLEVLDRPNTVGCVVLDGSGNVAAGTSTGGTTGQPKGRVGDTALVGCGLYADNQYGACSTTGDGESIIPVVLAKTAVDALAGDRHPDEAAKQAIATLQSRVEGEAGCILIDRFGRVGWAYNSSHMAVAYMTNDLQEPVFSTQKNQMLMTT